MTVKEQTTVQNGEVKDVTILRAARCEGCGSDAVYIDWPAGWSQTGGSQFGDKYDKGSIAWWCPACRKQSE